MLLSTQLPSNYPLRCVTGILTDLLKAPEQFCGACGTALTVTYGTHRTTQAIVYGSHRNTHVLCKVSIELPKLLSKVFTALPTLLCKVPIALLRLLCKVSIELPKLFCKVFTALPTLLCKVPIEIRYCVRYRQHCSCYCVRYPWCYSRLCVTCGKLTCSKPPRSSVVSMALLMGSTCRVCPVNSASRRTMLDLPLDEAPTWHGTKDQIHPELHVHTHLHASRAKTQSLQMYVDSSFSSQRKQQTAYTLLFVLTCIWEQNRTFEHLLASKSSDADGVLSFCDCGLVLRNCISSVEPHQLSFLSVLFLFFSGGHSLRLWSYRDKSKTELTENWCGTTKENAIPQNWPTVVKPPQDRTTVVKWVHAWVPSQWRTLNKNYGTSYLRAISQVALSQTSLCPKLSIFTSTCLSWRLLVWGILWRSLLGCSCIKLPFQLQNPIQGS